MEVKTRKRGRAPSFVPEIYPRLPAPEPADEPSAVVAENKVPMGWAMVDCAMHAVGLVRTLCLQDAGCELGRTVLRDRRLFFEVKSHSRMVGKHFYLDVYVDSPGTDPKLAFAFWHGTKLLKSFKYTPKSYHATKNSGNAYPYEAISAQVYYVMVQYMEQPTNPKRVGQRDIYEIDNETWTPEDHLDERQKAPDPRIAVNYPEKVWGVSHAMLLVCSGLHLKLRMECGDAVSLTSIFFEEEEKTLHFIVDDHPQARCIWKWQVEFTVDSPSSNPKLAVAYYECDRRKDILKINSRSFERAVRLGSVCDIDKAVQKAYDKLLEKLEVRVAEPSVMESPDEGGIAEADHTANNEHIANVDQLADSIWQPAT